MRRSPRPRWRHTIRATPTATHPTSCPCDGTGYIEGPPIHSQQHGQPFEYTTVTPCPGPTKLFEEPRTKR